MDHPADRRRQLGAWYTPGALVDHVVAHTVPATLTGRITVLDPACGDGRFLTAAARVVRERGGDPVLIGVDLDPDAIRAARDQSELRDALLVCADALAPSPPWPSEGVDIVVGNPPFLSPLSSRVRADDQRRGVPSPAGAYADAAVRFLDIARRTVRPGGHIGLVLPISVLGSRDARAVRSAVMDDCQMEWFWWSPTPVFDAAVTTCAVGLHRVHDRRRDATVVRSSGLPIVQLPSVASPLASAETWGELVADDQGVPSVEPNDVAGRLGDRATVTADFRDQYYGLVEAIVDADPVHELPADVVALVSTALIDPGVNLWGRRAIRYGKQRWSAPAVDVSQLDGVMRDWAVGRLVPKVMVATQTAVIEAVADLDGTCLPAVPVISVVPSAEVSVEEIAAVLTSPVPSALVARRAAGTGMSPRVVRVTARHLADLPWPGGTLADAVAALRAGDVEGCGRAVSVAYGLRADTQRELHTWWSARLPSRTSTRTV